MSPRGACSRSQSLIAGRFTVIDEADEMLSDGWEEIMDKLFQGSGLFQQVLVIVQTDLAHRRKLGC